MPPELTKAALSIGMWVTLLSAGCLLLTERGTAEFVVSAMSLGVGIFLLVVVIIVHRLSTR